MEHNKKVLVLARAVEATFASSEWTELGHLTDTVEWIEGHHRLLRSLYWGDDDYKGHVFAAVAHILKNDPSNLARLIGYEPIASWLEKNDPEALASLQAEAAGIAPPQFAPLSSSQAARDALADAQALLSSRGPASAFDRVHTGLHAFLKAACQEAGLTAADDATPNQLLKLILAEHPRLTALGARADDIRKILRSAGAVIDALGTLRNNASRAHPNDTVLDDEAALLAINVSRSILRYLDSKLSEESPF